MANAAKIVLTEGDAPASPSAGTTSIYFKTDHVLYKKDHDGTETAFSAGGISNIVEDVTPQLGGDLDLNEKAISIAPAPSADTWEGNVITLTAHENMGAIGVLGFINASGEVALTDADAAATMPGCVLSTAATLADAAGVFLLPGSVIHLHTLNPTWTIGGLVYAGSGAGPHTAGALNQTPPAGDSDVVQIVGVALAADILLFMPSLVTVEAHA
jgi:hypothetical protein